MKGIELVGKMFAWKNTRRVATITLYDPNLKMFFFQAQDGSQFEWASQEHFELALEKGLIVLVFNHWHTYDRPAGLAPGKLFDLQTMPTQVTAC